MRVKQRISSAILWHVSTLKQKCVEKTKKKKILKEALKKNRSQYEHIVKVQDRQLCTSLPDSAFTGATLVV